MTIQNDWATQIEHRTTPGQKGTGCLFLVLNYLLRRPEGPAPLIQRPTSEMRLASVWSVCLSACLRRIVDKFVHGQKHVNALPPPKQYGFETKLGSQNRPSLLSKLPYNELLAGPPNLYTFWDTNCRVVHLPMAGAVEIALVSKHAPIWRLGCSRNHSFRAVLEAGATLALRVLSSYGIIGAWTGREMRQGS